MGSPKKQRKKFSKPSHPWQKERILAEQELSKSYGLRRKFEIWKMNSTLKNFTSQAKNLITTKKQQSDIERSQLLKKLSSLGLIESGSKIEDVLSLTLKDVMDRRLQTLVFKKNMARSLTQARQFIVHEHICIGEKKITAPSYLVQLSEEANIQFTQGSSFTDSNHPERIILESKKTQNKTEITEKEEPTKETTSKDDKKENKPKEKKKTDKKDDEIKETKTDDKEQENKTDVKKTKTKKD